MGEVIQFPDKFSEDRPSVAVELIGVADLNEVAEVIDIAKNVFGAAIDQAVIETGAETHIDIKNEGHWTVAKLSD
jgi:predicted aldo/keto reductase-like oxidoreductase